MANNNSKLRKKDSAKLVWDTKPRRTPNPKDIEFQTAEIDSRFFLLDTCHSWHMQGRDVTVCFDLPKGKSTLDV